MLRIPTFQAKLGGGLGAVKKNKHIFRLKGTYVKKNESSAEKK
jgi:hypothetical protein